MKNIWNHHPVLSFIICWALPKHWFTVERGGVLFIKEGTLLTHCEHLRVLAIWQPLNRDIFDSYFFLVFFTIVKLWFGNWITKNYYQSYFNQQKLNIYEKNPQLFNLLKCLNGLKKRSKKKLLDTKKNPSHTIPWKIPIPQKSLAFPFRHALQIFLASGWILDFMDHGLLGIFRGLEILQTVEGGW